jgi:hypothetical protein
VSEYFSKALLSLCDLRGCVFVRVVSWMCGFVAVWFHVCACVSVTISANLCFASAECFPGCWIFLKQASSDMPAPSMLLDRVFESICRPLKVICMLRREYRLLGYVGLLLIYMMSTRVGLLFWLCSQVRIEQVLMSSPTLLLCFRLSHLLAFYNSTIKTMLDEGALLVETLKVGVGTSRTSAFAPLSDHLRVLPDLGLVSCRAAVRWPLGSSMTSSRAKATS